MSNSELMNVGLLFILLMGITVVSIASWNIYDKLLDIAYQLERIATV